MVNILGLKPSQLRKDLLTVLAAVGAVAGIIVSLAASVPQIGAFVGIAGAAVTIVSRITSMLTAGPLAAGIDALDRL